MKTVAIEKPYFKGQTPSHLGGGKCKHYYPDVLRNYDEVSPSGKAIIRHAYCFKCKKEYTKRIRPEELFNPDIFEKKRSIRELSLIRERELKRFEKEK